MAAGGLASYTNLCDQIDKTGSYALNADEATPYTCLFNTDPSSCVRSDADEQLLFQFTFQSPMKIFSLNFIGLDDDSAPCTVKLFVNRPGMTFDDVDGVEPTQTLKLTPEDLREDGLTKLRFVRFQKVTQLTVFIEDNAGAEITQLVHLGIFGESIHRTNMDELKKSG